ncbi:MAG: putative tellurite resistance protein B-like protein [Myxococcota bacterium]|jgi:uncharacterized tellurite resistance protein B-like protein
MSQSDLPWELEHEWLLHETVLDGLPGDGLPAFFCECVRECVDVSRVRDAWAPHADADEPPHFVSMMIALLVHAYSDGTFSSRAIARDCWRRLDLLSITGAHPVEFEQVRSFRELTLQVLAHALLDVLRACRAAGLSVGELADGEDDDERTAVGFGNDQPLANEIARWVKAARAADALEDELYGPDGDRKESPRWVATMGGRKERIAAAISERLAREQAMAALADDPDEEPPPKPPKTRGGRKKTGSRQPVPPPAPIEMDDAEEDDATDALLARAARAAKAITSTPPSNDPDRKPRRRAHSRGTTDVIAAMVDEPKEERSRNRLPSSGIRRPMPRSKPVKVAPVAAAPALPPEPKARRSGPPPVPDERVSAAETPAAAVSTGAAAALSTLRKVKRPEDRVRLLEVMVAAALADGKMTSVEERRLEQSMRFLRVDDETKRALKKMMMRTGNIPLPTVDEIPDYDVRLHCFEQATRMVLVDGPPNKDEMVFLKVLAQEFELDATDARDALKRVNESP